MTEHTAVRAAVIGLGRMGMHHVRACADTPGVNLVAVLDERPDITIRVAKETGCLGSTNLDGLLGQIDIAVIAVPTQHHVSTAVPLLQSGVSCLVEKPIASNENDAAMMINAAATGDVCLRVGHVERFNPAIASLTSALDRDLKNGSSIKSISSRRLNIAVDRPYDIDAVLDLMIHDLDLLNVLEVGTVTSIECEPGTTEHRVTVTLALDSGVTASLDVSRVASDQDRGLSIETTDSILEVDFTAKTVTSVVDGVSTALMVDETDPLRAQLAAFVAAIRGEESIVATGQDGLAALRLANRIRESAGLL